MEKQKIIDKITRHIELTQKQLKNQRTAEALFVKGSPEKKNRERHILYLWGYLSALKKILSVIDKTDFPGKTE
jgi:hypothetical protein